MSVRGALDLNGHMVPLIVQRFARHSGGMPFLSGIVPRVPFIPAGDAALVSPNIRMAVHELIDVELKGLCGADVTGEEINVIDKIVRAGVDAVIGIPHILRRKLSDEVVIPEYVRICGFAADGELHGLAAERGGTYTLVARPCGLRPASGARGANSISRR